MNFPTDFISSIQPLLGIEKESFLSALSGDASVSFRLNPLKEARNPMKPVIPYERVPWSQWGFYLEERPSFTFDPLFHAGYYYVQEASSMFIEHIVRTLLAKEEGGEPVICLDLCAAPGGKSISLLSALPEGSLLVSNELVRQRAHVLSETTSKFGNPNVIVTNNTAKDFAHFPHLFDCVLVDAPCSGEGMFRKDEGAVEEWSLQNVEMCAIRQREILSDVWPALKPGGVLVYSTCTYNTRENEENASWIATELGAEFLQIEIDELWGISPSQDKQVSGYRFFPHKIRGEGFFVTVLRKTEDESGNVSHGGRRMKNKNKKKPSPFIKFPAAYFPLLLHPDSFNFLEEDNRIVAIPSGYSEVFMMLSEQLRIVSKGIEVGEIKGNDFVPSHRLALSMELKDSVFPRYELTYGEAISYLRREVISIPDAPKGYLLVTYKEEPLGFVKNIANRANNLYPNEWRIRSGHLPEKSVDIFTFTS